jgi:hypothetical protein
MQMLHSKINRFPSIVFKLNHSSISLQENQHNAYVKFCRSALHFPKIDFPHVDTVIRLFQVHCLDIIAVQVIRMRSHRCPATKLKQLLKSRMDFSSGSSSSTSQCHSPTFKSRPQGCLTSKG